MRIRRRAFKITSGPNGGPCSGASLPFSPSLTGGTTNINAGAFSPFTMTIGREDGEQNMQSVQLHMPPGLSGLLSGVKLCPEAQAERGDVRSGKPDRRNDGLRRARRRPVHGHGRQVSTSPARIEGAPFGLSIVEPREGGPVRSRAKSIVRAKIEVEPDTAALTITTDDSGPYAIPTHHRRDPAADQARQRSRSTGPNFHVQPDELQPDGKSPGRPRAPKARRDADRVPFQVTNCANLEVHPEIPGLDNGQDQQSRSVRA